MTTGSGPSLPEPVPSRLAAGAFVLVDKPRGPSSHQVTAWARDLLGVPRAGHAGTLDPNVSGLLWVGLGPALRLLPLVLEFPKRYVGVVGFHATVAKSDFLRVLGEFRGPIFQTPPVRSAVRRERRVRTIYRLELLEFDPPHAVIDLVADSGTYVRTLAVDLGDALGVGAHLEELRRIGTGPFTEDDAITLAQLADAVAQARDGTTAPLEAILHPAEEVWREFPRVVLRDAAVAAIAHGADLARGGIADLPRPFAQGASVVLVDRKGTLVALGRALRDSSQIPAARHGWVVDAQRVFVDPTHYPRSWKTRGKSPVVEASASDSSS